VLSRGDHLILTDDFPGYDDRGRGTDAYQAAVAARSAGRRPDVFRLAPVEATAYHEYEGFDCITGSEPALAALIASGRHAAVEVLATDEATGAILERHSETIRRRP
jgi:hypothetical protein